MQVYRVSKVLDCQDLLVLLQLLLLLLVRLLLVRLLLLLMVYHLKLLLEHIVHLVSRLMRGQTASLRRPCTASGAFHITIVIVARVVVRFTTATSDLHTTVFAVDCEGLVVLSHHR